MRGAAHGPIGSPDARIDRTRRGRGERGGGDRGAVSSRSTATSTCDSAKVIWGARSGGARNSVPGGHASAGITDTAPRDRLRCEDPSGRRIELGSRLSTDPMPPGTLVPPPPDRPSGTGTLTPPHPPLSATQPVPDTLNVATVGNFRPPSAGELPAGSASAQYNAAFGLIKQADYPAAEEALKTFVAQHPKDPLAGSAQYWLG